MTLADGASAQAAGDRDHFIPVRKIDILDALIEHGSLASEAEREKFRQVCRLLGAIYHYEYFELLEKLRHAYFYFNPDFDGKARFDAAALERNYGELIESFVAVLKGANFVEVPQEEIERAHQESAAVRVALRTPVEDFREVRFFRRGHHTESFEIRRWFGLKRGTLEAVVYDDVVLLVAMKSEAQMPSKRERKRLAQRKIRPGAVLIKYFRNIASQDLNALFPNVEIVMSLRDKLFLGVPALAGSVPILLNIWSTVTVLFLVIGFYLGITAAVREDEMTTALAAMSGLVALGGFVMRQWVKYQRQSLKYQQVLTDNVYYRNINNNSGIFDYIIGAAEEQECKEAFLAYYFLSTAASAPTQEELDARIEAWLKDKFSFDIDFEVDDALAKLDRLGLLRRAGERLSVPAPEAALARLDYIWDNYFQFNVAEAEAAGARV
ncbi:MAG: hypothetical protein QOG83_1192 [Alphaproteobacteria bacterium]|nr:hypothetical protein [Alphaproteobacteria bacterium]